MAPDQLNTVVIGWTPGELDLITNSVKQTLRYMPGRILLSDPWEDMLQRIRGRRNLIIFRLSDSIRFPVPVESQISRLGCIYCTVTPI